MTGIPGPFGGSASGDAAFDDYDAFVPANVPDPGPFLRGNDVLAGRRHAAFHRLTRAIFEARGVYDMTFGYNLARLNLDPRHPDAGYRYAEADDGVLHAEFTPTTPFCPQSDTLTKGSFRAWNGLRDRHEYDLVRVRVDEMHHQSAAINDTLERLAAQFEESGVVPGSEHDGRSAPENGPECGDGAGTTSRGYGADAPF